jgi:hypothetical protein
MLGRPSPSRRTGTTFASSHTSSPVLVPRCDGCIARYQAPRQVVHHWRRRGARMVKQEELTIRRTHEPVGNHPTQPNPSAYLAGWQPVETRPNPNQIRTLWVGSQTELNCRTWTTHTPNDSNNNNALLMALFLHCRSNFKISNQF